MSDVIDLDGQLVSAKALGWDGSETDDTDWSLYPSDLPLLTNQTGHLVVNYVDELDYTQFVVNGVPVDPDTIQRVDYTGHEVLVASGWEGVPRDEDGKWTTGPGGIGTWAPTPPPQTPGQLPLWTKAQESAHKAVATKKAKAAQLKAAQEQADKLQKALDDKAAADEAAAAIQAAMNSPQAKADKTLTAAIDLIAGVATTHGAGKAAYPSADVLDNASPEIVDAYLKTTLGSSYDKTLAKLSQPPSTTALRNLAVATSNQHLADTKLLNGIGYLSDRPATAVDARRAVLRETGERKPTGGPGSGQAVHTFYGEDTIRALPKEKQAAIVVHHTAGSYTMAQALGLNSDTLVEKAVQVDRDYKSAVEMLTAKGVDPSTIPHSNAGAQYMGYGSTKGLKPLAAATVSQPITTSSTPMGKPANWASMSPGKKAAWTKKYGKGQTAAQQEAIHPADWASMSPGKKAAWTKKHNAGGVTSTYADPHAPSPGKPAVATSGNAKTFKPVVPLGKHTEPTFSAKSDAKEAARKYQESLPNDAVHTPPHQLNTTSNQMSSAQKKAWTSYYDGGYHAMNDCAKYGKGCTPYIKQKIAALQSSIAEHGTPTSKRLWRGKSSGPMKDLDFNVGEEFTEDSFGSWSTDKNFAFSWGSFGYSDRSVVYNLVDSHGAKSVPSASGESERIMPRGTRYRVVGIHDFVHGDMQNRVLDVELVYAPVG